MKKVLMIVLVAILALASLPAAFAQEDTIEIRFLHIFGDENRQGLVDDVIADFEAANPNINVTAEVAGSYPEALESVMLAAEQGEPPHIVQMYEVGTQLALDSGVFIPVSSVASEEQLATLEDVIQPVLNYYTVAEEVWSLPWNSSSPILYYNQEMLDAAGVTEVPDTFGEVLAACEQIMATESLELQGCMGWNMHSWFVEQWMAQQNAPLANNDNGRTARADDLLIDSEPMLKIFNWWKEMADSGYYIYTGAKEDWNGSDALFTGQQVAMHITSTADLVNIINGGTEAGFTVGTGQLPIPDDAERNGVVIGGASIWLTDGHPQEELEAAVQFMLFLGNTENMVDWHKGTGYYPVRVSSIDALEAEGWFEDNPTFRTAFDQLLNTNVNTATAGALMGTFQTTRTIIEDAAQLVVDQGVSPEDALAEADDLADNALAAYNRGVR